MSIHSIILKYGYYYKVLHYFILVGIKPNVVTVIVSENDKTFLMYALPNNYVLG